MPLSVAQLDLYHSRAIYYLLLEEYLKIFLNLKIIIKKKLFKMGLNSSVKNKNLFNLFEFRQRIVLWQLQHPPPPQVETYCIWLKTLDSLGACPCSHTWVCSMPKAVPFLLPAAPFLPGTDSVLRKTINHAYVHIHGSVACQRLFHFSSPLPPFYPALIVC